MKKYQCPCCEYYTYNVPANEDCGYICPVCFWENDPLLLPIVNQATQSRNDIERGKNNYLKFGACEKAMLCHVRPPKDNEKG